MTVKLKSYETGLHFQLKYFCYYKKQLHHIIELPLV